MSFFKDFNPQDWIGQSINSKAKSLSDNISDFFSKSTSLRALNPSFGEEFVSGLGTPDYKTSASQTILRKQESVSTTATFKFPTHNQNAPHTFVLRFAEYDRKKAHNSKLEYLKSRAIVSLPMPIQGLVDTTSVNWTPGEMGWVGDVAETTSDAIDKVRQWYSGTPTTGTEEGLRQNPLVTAGAAGLRLLEGSAELFGGEAVVGLLEQEKGQILNPHATVYFKGISLRSHNLSWRLSAKTKQESKDLQELLRIIKTNALPSKSTSTSYSFLKYPSMVKPAIMYKSKENKDYFYDFKWCGVQSISINYAPEGTPLMFKETGAPVIVDLGINLQELEYQTTTDAEVESTY